MSWAWLVPLALGGLAAAVLARVARAVEQEREKVALSRLRLAEIREESHAEGRAQSRRGQTGTSGSSPGPRPPTG